MINTPVTDGKRRRTGWSPDGKKICPNCNEPTSPDNFYGHSSYCRDCGSDLTRRQRQRREERDPDKYRIRRRESKLRSRYKLTAEGYSKILSSQGFACKICGISNPGREEKFFLVDHDHIHCSGERSCGRCPRGLLCFTCNMGIGYLGDDPQRLRGAADYIERFRADNPDLYKGLR